MACKAARIHLDPDARRPLRGFLGADGRRARLRPRPFSVGRSALGTDAECRTHESRRIDLLRLARRRACFTSALRPRRDCAYIDETDETAIPLFRNKECGEDSMGLLSRILFALLLLPLTMIEAGA